MVWITALILILSVTIGWYMGLTVFNSIASANMALIGTGEGLTLAKLLQYANIAWGPLFDVIILIWALTYPAERDAISY